MWGLPVQPVEVAANMLAARLGFDLLRSPAFEASAMAYIQKKLDQLRLPAYIGPLQVGAPPRCQSISIGLHCSHLAKLGRG